MTRTISRIGASPFWMEALTLASHNPIALRAHGLAKLRVWLATAALGAVTTTLCGPAAYAARVSGVLVGYENSTPEKSRDLHFENQITRDIYLSPSHDDGSFGAEIPPGTYDLRAERGAILVHSISVGAADVKLGTVNELAPYAPRRLFDLQSVAVPILTSPAPSTAYLYTIDTTVLSSNAATIPNPDLNWSKSPAEVPAAAVGANTTPAQAQTPLTPPPPSPENEGKAGDRNQLFQELPMNPQTPVNPNTAKP
jgi:hypothetical protein